MKIVVFGANGRVGQLVVAELLRRGHNVRAFVHGNSLFETSEQLEVFQGDVYDEASVSKAVTGMDAVMSTLGSWGTKKKDVLTAGMQHIIPAMQSAQITKIVSLTGADCKVNGDKMDLIHNLTHAVFSVMAGKILKDGERHANLLEESGLSWTVLRSPVMNDSGNPESYQLRSIRPKPWHTINRKSVALALADLVEQDQVVLQSPFITRK